MQGAASSLILYATLQLLRESDVGGVLSCEGARAVVREPRIDPLLERLPCRLNRCRQAVALSISTHVVGGADVCSKGEVGKGGMTDGVVLAADREVSYVGSAVL